jgi:hypothetical protein
MIGEARAEAARVLLVVFSVSPRIGPAPLAGSTGCVLARRTLLGRRGIIEGA